MVMPTHRPGIPSSLPVFPRPGPVATIPCRDCQTPTRVDRAVDGYGERCAEKRGLIVSRPRLRSAQQTGPDLMDQFDEEDHCDGWDR